MAQKSLHAHTHTNTFKCPFENDKNIYNDKYEWFKKGDEQGHTHT